MEHVAAVRARGITKAYGDVGALDGVDVDMAEGQVHGLVGPNDAGKTTLLGLLLVLAVPDGGVLGTTSPSSTPSSRRLGLSDPVQVGHDWGVALVLDRLRRHPRTFLRWL